MWPKEVRQLPQILVASEWQNSTGDCRVPTQIPLQDKVLISQQL